MAEGIVIPVIVEGQQASLSLEALAKALADATTANEKFNQSQKSTAAGAGALVGVFQGIAQGVGQFVAAKGFQAIESLASSFTHAIEAGSRFTNLAAQLNTTAEALQVLQAQASAVDVPFGVIQRSLNITQRNLTTAGKAFREFGIDVSKLSTDSAVRFNQIVEAIRKIDDPTRQAAAAFKLLGDRSGQVLRLIRSDLTGAADDAKNFGLVISDALSANLEKVGSQFKLLGQVLESVSTNIVAPIAASEALQVSLRLVTEVIGSISKAVQDNGAAITEWTNAAILFAIDALIEATKIIDFLIESLAALADTVVTVGGFIINDLIKPIFDFEAAVLKVATFGLVDFDTALKNIGLIVDVVKLGFQFATLGLVAFGIAINKVASFIPGLTTAAEDNLRVLNLFADAKVREINATIAGEKAAKEEGGALEGLRVKLANAKVEIEKLIKAHQQHGETGKKTLGVVKAAAEATKQAIKEAEAATKAQNAALEAQLALFQKRQQLATINVSLGSEGDKAVFAAQQAAVAAQQEFTTRTAILANEIALVAKKRELQASDELAVKALNQQAVELQRQLDIAGQTLQISLQIAAAQKQIAEIQRQAATENRATATLAEQLALAVELEHTQDRLLTGQLAANKERDKSVQLLTIEADKQAKLANTQIKAIRAQEEAIQRQADAGNISQAQADEEVVLLDKQKDILEQQLVDLAKKLGIQIQIANVTAKEVTFAQKVGASFKEVAAGKGFGNAVQGLSSGISQVAGKAQDLVAGFQNVKAAIDKGGTAFQRAFAVGAAGAKLGESIGSIFGPQGAAIGKLGGALVGGLIGIFHKPAWQKVGEEAGKILGVKVSAELAKAIQKTSKELKITVKSASLLALPAAIAESGKKAHEFAGQIDQLLTAISTGAVPAEQGIASLGEAFNKIADEAIASGKVGDKVLTDLIKKARKLGVESPEIKAFVSQQLEAAVAGVNQFIDSLSKLTAAQVAKVGADAGTIFGATFAAVVSEKGILAAVDSLSGSFEKLKKSLTDALGADQANALVAPFAVAFAQLGEGSPLRPIFEAIDGITQAFKGLANAAFLDVTTFRAATHAIGTLFDEAISGGVDAKTALTAIAPSIQAAVSAASQFGIPLDADTARLKALAEANGIAFKVDPIEKAANAISLVAEALNKVFHLGLDLSSAFDGVANSASGAADEIGRAAAAGQAAIPGAPGAVGGPAAVGGAAGPRVNNIAISATINVAENPLVAAQTLAQVRQATIGWVADAFEDRVASLIAAAA